ncbi:MAG TPA: YxlC family protein [Bacillaceae bacterium]
MKDNKEQEWLDQFKKDLEKVDRTYEPAVPSQFQLLNTLNEFKAERKRAFKRELIAFLVTALLILAAYMVVVFKLPPVFLWVQGFTLLMIPVIFFAERKRIRKRNGVAGDGI